MSPPHPEAIWNSLTFRGAYIFHILIFAPPSKDISFFFFMDRYQFCNAWSILLFWFPTRITLKPVVLVVVGGPDNGNGDSLVIASQTSPLRTTCGNKKGPKLRYCCLWLIQKRAAMILVRCNNCTHKSSARMLAVGRLGYIFGTGWARSYVFCTWNEQEGFTFEDSYQSGDWRSIDASLATGRLYLPLVTILTLLVDDPYILVSFFFSADVI